MYEECTFSLYFVLIVIDQASGARASPKTAEQNESKLSTKPSISSSRKNDTSSSSPQLSEIGGGISQNYTSSRPDLTTQPPREKAVRLRPNVGPSPQKSDQQFIRPGHRLTGFSTSSVNSKIRLAYWEHKKIRVDSFDDIKKVPGTEILVFDNTPGAERYVVKKKAEMQAKCKITLRLCYLASNVAQYMKVSYCVFRDRQGVGSESQMVM